MITPQIKSLISPDTNRPNLPDDPQNCSVFCEAEIGSTNSEGADIFSFTVATPSALTSETRFLWGRGLLIVPSFSWETVDLALARLLAQATRPTWPEVVHELSKNMHWEFENYHEAKHV